MAALRGELENEATGQEELVVAKEAGRVARRVVASHDGSVRTIFAAVNTATESATETPLPAIEAAIGQVGQAIRAMTNLVSVFLLSS